MIGLNVDWIMTTLLTPLTALTGWFIAALEAAGIKDYFFFFFGTGFIILCIFRINMPVSGGDIAQTMYEREHPYRLETISRSERHTDRGVKVTYTKNRSITKRKRM